MSYALNTPQPHKYLLNICYTVDAPPGVAQLASVAGPYNRSLFSSTGSCLVRHTTGIYLSKVRGAQGEGLVPPHTRGSVSLSLAPFPSKVLKLS